MSYVIVTIGDDGTVAVSGTKSGNPITSLAKAIKARDEIIEEFGIEADWHVIGRGL